MNYKNKKVIEETYKRNGSIKKSAIELGINEKTFAAWMKKFNIPNKRSQGARVHKFNYDFFEKIDSEEKAYWVGFIYADGCLYSSTDNKSMRIQINLSSVDIEHLNRFQKSIGSNYKISIGKIKKSEYCSIKVNSTKMCKDLISHGVVPRKSLYSSIPIVTEKYFRHMLRGFFDGDGTIDCPKKTIRLRMVGGEKPLEEIKKKLKNFSIDSKIYLKKKDVFSLEVLRKKDAEKLYSLMYDNSMIFLERKKHPRCPL